jgi:hypothetical protein
MNITETLTPSPAQALVEWAVTCQAEADDEVNPEAKSAFQQLAEEFQVLADEVEGIISTFEALKRRKTTA